MLRRACCPLVGASDEVANKTLVARGMDLSRHFKKGDERNCDRKNHEAVNNTTEGRLRGCAVDFDVIDN